MVSSGGWVGPAHEGTGGSQKMSRERFVGNDKKEQSKRREPRRSDTREVVYIYQSL